MYLLFLDESGTPPSREKAEGKFFVLGGVAINDKSLNQIYSSVGLQLADLIAGSFYRNYQSKDSYFMNKLLFNKKPLLIEEEGVDLSSGDQLALFNALNALPT
jgi:hypothetical protein